MKFYAIIFLLCYNACLGQAWMGEVMVGTSAYNGDLTQSIFSVKRLNPAAEINIKYHSGDVLDVRMGILYGGVSANDKDNKRPDLQARNLSFKSNILEFNVITEVNVMDPQIYDSYLYFFGGIGIFHFNPYTYDDAGKKTYLHPLSTEGEGLPEYPARKNYSLIQPCLIGGVGFKWKLNEKQDLSFEFGYRYLFTDYLDDVSKTYVSQEILSYRKGPEAAALAYRKDAPFAEEGFPRGNPKVKDYYFVAGLKFAFRLSKPKDQY